MSVVARVAGSDRVYGVMPVVLLGPSATGCTDGQLESSCAPGSEGGHSLTQPCVLTAPEARRPAAASGETSRAVRA
jgi:hypothetical protein